MQLQTTSIQIDRFQVLHELGRGGHGVVYLVQDPERDKPVALKVMRPGETTDAKLPADLRAMLDATAALQHPNIVPIYEVGEAAGSLYLSQEYLDGGSLAQQLDGRTQSGRQAAAFVETLARAVHSAHEKGIMHGHLKPSNILLAAEPRPPSVELLGLKFEPPPVCLALSSYFPKIADFGFAQRSDPKAARRQPEAVRGTSCYLAPEQCDETRPPDVGPATDVYALGAILYEMLTGQPPFCGPTDEETRRQIACSEVVAPRRLQALVSRDLEAICLKCLKKDPKRRYASALALAEDLGRYLLGRPVQARTEQLPERLKRFARRHRRLCAAAGALLGMVTLAVLFKYRDYWQRESGASAAELKLIQDELAAGKAVELVGEKRLPRWYRFRAGNTKLFSGSNPFGIKSYPASLLDLLPDPQRDSYRIRADVRLTGDSWVEAGIYFACRERATPEGVEQWFCDLRFGESENVRRVALLTTGFREGNLTREAVHYDCAASIYRLPRPLSPKQSWHELAVDVRPDKLKVYWEEKFLGERTWGQVTNRLIQQAQLLSSLSPNLNLAPADCSPRGSLGLYVHKGGADFRHVVVEPLGD